MSKKLVFQILLKGFWTLNSLAVRKYIETSKVKTIANPAKSLREISMTLDVLVTNLENHLYKLTYIFIWCLGASDQTDKTAKHISACDSLQKLPHDHPFLKKLATTWYLLIIYTVENLGDQVITPTITPKPELIPKKSIVLRVLFSHCASHN